MPRPINNLAGGGLIGAASAQREYAELATTKAQTTYDATPTLLDTLKEHRRYHQEKLEQVEKAIALVEANPAYSELVDTLAKIR